MSDLKLALIDQVYYFKKSHHAIFIANTLNQTYSISLDGTSLDNFLYDNKIYLPNSVEKKFCKIKEIKKNIYAIDSICNEIEYYKALTNSNSKFREIAKSKIISFYIF